jgi:5'(3')-deoxyribonucleotidase
MMICIDIDDVLCNLQEVVIDLFNKRYGSNYNLEDFTEYDIMNVLPTQDAIVMKDMYGEIGLYDKVKPMPGAQKALEKLINLGHQVYLVTAAIPKTYGEKVAFIKRFFPYIDESHIICMKHKHLLRCDIMIEDNLQTLLAGQHYHRVLFDRPWNKFDKDWVYGISRCNSWSKILDEINQINEWER